MYTNRTVLENVRIKMYTKPSGYYFSGFQK